MRNINRSCLPVVFAATLLGISSCSNPSVRPDRREPSATTRAVPDEVLAEVEAAEEVVVVALDRTGEARSREKVRAAEALPAVERAAVEPAVEKPEVDKPAIARSAPEVVQEAVVEEAPASAEPSVKVMGPWVAGDQIDSERPGVKPIEILQVYANGAGDLCGTGKLATLRYVAMKADGSVLDPGREPYTFRVGTGNAIAGWHVVVAKMRVGDSFTLMLPEALAYRGKGDLKFDMELLSFQ